MTVLQVPPKTIVQECVYTFSQEIYKVMIVVAAIFDY